MPELPEVETVKRVLTNLVLNKTVKDIEVYYEKILKNKTVEEFSRLLIGHTITSIRRRGKYLFIDFDNVTLTSHLRMEGKYNYSDDYEENTKHDIVKFKFTDGSELTYNDVRRFGTMEITDKGKEKNLKSVSKLGFEPFDEDLTAKYLYELSRKKSIYVKSFLLDQSVITGLGNIYVDEVLFLSQIHPETRVNTLNEEQYQTLIDNSIIVLNKAIDEGGSTIKTFSISGDVHGRFQNSLNVYGKENEDCVRCGNKIKKIKVGGRGTHYCEVCQPKIEDR